MATISLRSYLGSHPALALPGVHGCLSGSESLCGLSSPTSLCKNYRSAATPRLPLPGLGGGIRPWCLVRPMETQCHSLSETGEDGVRLQDNGPCTARQLCQWCRGPPAWSRTRMGVSAPRAHQQKAPGRPVMMWSAGNGRKGWSLPSAELVAGSAQEASSPLTRGQIGNHPPTPAVPPGSVGPLR